MYRGELRPVEDVTEKWRAFLDVNNDPREACEYTFAAHPNADHLLLQLPAREFVCVKEMMR